MLEGVTTYKGSPAGGVSFDPCTYVKLQRVRGITGTYGQGLQTWWQRHFVKVGTLLVQAQLERVL